MPQSRPSQQPSFWKRSPQMRKSALLKYYSVFFLITQRSLNPEDPRRTAFHKTLPIFMNHSLGFFSERLEFCGANL